MNSHQLNRLKNQRLFLQSFLQEQRESLGKEINTGMRLAIEAYIHILEDAISTLDTMIKFNTNELTELKDIKPRKNIEL